MPRQKHPERLLSIVDAAMEVFAQQGFAGAQMADVARQAGVSVGTLYNYVEGKGALLLLSAERPFCDISQGRSLPIPTPDRAELLARLEATLATHVRLPTLEHAVAHPAAAADLDVQVGEVAGDLFDLIARSRVGADAMERSARDAPDLGELFYRQVRVPLLDRLSAYCTAVAATRPLPSPLTPDLAARSLLETVTWWARHRHRDPDPPPVDDATARQVAIALVTASLRR